MDISQLTIKLIILLIPGAIGTIIVERLTVHKPWTSFRFTINSIVIGIFSYLLLQILLILKCCALCVVDDHSIRIDSLTIWNTFNQPTIIPYSEVVGSSILGIALGFLITKADTHKWLNSFAKKYKISYKYGDENLYSYFLNAKETNFVYIRNIKHKLTYMGQVNSYSETDEIKEIVLRNVSVYDYETSEMLYEVDRIYLSLPKDDTIIEFAITTT